MCLSRADHEVLARDAPLNRLIRIKVEDDSARAAFAAPQDQIAVQIKPHDLPKIVGV
jgi:hypothetical protein